MQRWRGGCLSCLVVRRQQRSSCVVGANDERMKLLSFLSSLSFTSLSLSFSLPLPLPFSPRPLSLVLQILPGGVKVFSISSPLLSLLFLLPLFRRWVRRLFSFPASGRKGKKKKKKKRASDSSAHILSPIHDPSIPPPFHTPPPNPQTNPTLPLSLPFHNLHHSILLLLSTSLILIISPFHPHLSFSPTLALPRSEDDIAPPKVNAPKFHPSIPFLQTPFP